MAPQEKETNFETNPAELMHEKTSSTRTGHKFKYSRNMIIFFTLVHIAGVYGTYLLFFLNCKLTTAVFAYALYAMSMVGITAGTHRLWAHRAYKANLPLRLILGFFSTIAFQSPILVWARDHRTHHKYTDTDADPHDITRGFFYAHIGWALTKKAEAVKAKGRTIDISDLRADSVTRLQHKYFWPLSFLIALILPAITPTLWGETIWNGVFVCTAFRLMFSYHSTFLINSAAHTFGMRPYDKSIFPGEVNLVSLLTLGDGFHNYHHTFPYDYRGSELGYYYLNFSGYFIYLMSKIGWAYDLKTASKELIKMRAKRTGDGSHGTSHNVWGWDDKDISKIDKENATIINPDGTKPYM